MTTPAQAVEFFHLQFVRLLCAGPDKEAFAIKGGCNLRFFFESVRYSEDIYLDVSERIPVHALKDRVPRILSGPALTLVLRNRGMEVGRISAPKQTETTQRWKLALSVEGHPAPLPTKVEFSRRGTSDTAVLGPIAPGVLAEHQAMQFLAPHYPLAAALRQKVTALAGRREVQARDLFDLGSVLIPRAGGDAAPLRPVRTALRPALERAMALTYADYKAQVVSYLQPDRADAEGSPEAWEAMQLAVVEYLDRAVSTLRDDAP